MLPQEHLLNEYNIPKSVILKDITRFEIPTAFVYQLQQDKFYFNRSKYLHIEITQNRIDNYLTCHQNILPSQKFEDTSIHDLLFEYTSLHCVTRKENQFICTCKLYYHTAGYICSHILAARHHINPLPVLQSNNLMPQSASGRKRKRSSALQKDKDPPKDPKLYLNQTVCMEQGDGLISLHIPSIKKWKVLFRDNLQTHIGLERDRSGRPFKVCDEEEIKYGLERMRRSFLGA